MRPVYGRRVYRFLLTPRWLGYLALTLVAAVVMVGLGRWQLDRYQARTAINDRIETASTSEPVPLAAAVPAPQGPAGSIGSAPPADSTWTRVRITGVYDRSNQLLVRGRTVEGRVGYEVVTPLVLADGTAVLVDRGWIPPAAAGAQSVPDVPAPPSGPVTVTGRVRAPESRAGEVLRRDGLLEARRVDPSALRGKLPYALYGGYVTVEPAEDGFVTVGPRKENAWQNAGYTLQWWLMAALALVGFGYVARREANGDRRPGFDLDDDPEPVPAGTARAKSEEV